LHCRSILLLKRGEVVDSAMVGPQLKLTYSSKLHAMQSDKMLASSYSNSTKQQDIAQTKVDTRTTPRKVPRPCSVCAGHRILVRVVHPHRVAHNGDAQSARPLHTAQICVPRYVNPDTIGGVLG